MMTLKQWGMMFAAASLMACGGESEVSETENSIEELGNVLEELNDDLNEVDGVNEIYPITFSAAGDFQLGEAIPESSDAYLIEKKTVSVATEEGSYDENVYMVSNLAGDHLLEIKEYYDYETFVYLPEIGELNVTSTLFQTDKGIGVESTISEFMEAYLDYSIWYTYVSDMYVIESEGLGPQFLLDPEGFSGELEWNSDMEVLSETDFAPDTEIIAVRLFRL